MADAVEVKQVPRHIVQAFVARYGKIGQRLDETSWLDLFETWYAGWQIGQEAVREREGEQEKKECSTDTTP